MMEEKPALGDPMVYIKIRALFITDHAAGLGDGHGHHRHMERRPSSCATHHDPSDAEHEAGHHHHHHHLHMDRRRSSCVKPEPIHENETLDEVAMHNIVIA